MAGQRSPQAPFFNLREGADRTMRVYDLNGLNTIPKEAAYRAMGYGGISGASRRALAALLAYGLLVSRGEGKVQVNPDFQAMKLTTDPQQRASLLEAFLRQPLAYSAILERFPESLPSNDTLMHFLVVELRYREPTARDVIKSFRESIEYAGYTAGVGKVVPIGTATETSQAMPVRVVTGSAALQAGPAKVSGSGTVTAGAPPTLDPTAYDDAIPIRLKGGRKAWLTLPKPFRESDKPTLVAAMQSIVADDEEDQS
jgi:hypothetical protein